MDDRLTNVSFVYPANTTVLEKWETHATQTNKKNTSELKQLHNLELLVRNEESLGFVEFYLRNQR